MYEAFSNSIFRSPLMPYNQLDEILSSKDSLLKMLADDKVQEAIFLASPILYKELKRMLSNKISDNSEIERIINSSVRYISRMSTRCTPFGLFAGCGVSGFGPNSLISITGSIARKTRLDMHYLYNLYNHIMKHPLIKSKIKYYPNSSIYTIGKNVRYVETLYEHASRKYQISEVEDSVYLRRILRKAKGGITFNNLIYYLHGDSISVEDATDFINDLINSQLLVGELFQAITGDDFLERLIALIEELDKDLNLLSLLKQIKGFLIQLDSNTVNPLEIYNEIISIIKSIDVPLEEKYLFQVDSLILPHHATLSNHIIDDLKNCLSFLNKISEDNNETIKNFQRDFYQKYEDGEVPLMEVLDPELGIGYPSKSGKSNISPLIDDLYLPNSNTDRSFALNSFQTFLLSKILEAKEHQKKEIVLTDDDISFLPDKELDLPPTIYTLLKILINDEGNHLIELNSFSGSSGANLLGRFAHIHSNLERSVREIVNKEKELLSGKVLAEIVHLPEFRVGNILSRPHIRDYELLYMATSDLNEKRLIYLSDITLSIKNDKLVLYSKKNKKEILPRLTTAHNYHNLQSMPVYRFLCDVQTQGKRGVFFSWGKLEEEFTFLPRVRYNNIILSPALWSIKLEKIEPIFSHETDKELLFAINEWRIGIGLPQRVLLSDGDNELYVDWGNLYCVKSLYSIIKNRKSFRLKEFLFDEQNALIKNKGNTYLNECIITFYKKDK